MDTIICKTCGKQTPKTVWNKKECDKCRKTYYKRYMAKRYKPSHHTKQCLDCGKTFETHTNKRIYCKACAKERFREQRRVYHINRKINKPEIYLFDKAKTRAKSMGREFNIELSDIVVPKICPLLQIPLIASFDKQYTYNSPSLDRIDSSKGYIKGNIVVVSWRANIIKGDATLKELELITNNLKKIILSKS